MALPATRTLTLRDAVKLIVECCSVTKCEALEWLRTAGRDGTIVAWGDRPLSAHPVARKRAEHPHREQVPIDPADWSQEIDLRAGAIGPALYFSARIDRASLQSALGIRTPLQSSSGAQKGGRKFEMARAILNRRFPNGFEDQSDKTIIQTVKVDIEERKAESLSDDTILRAAGRRN